ncbi:MAG TPA: CerR family C-terminal domain-containing protein [Acidobacteriaceae bacterium]|jgi:AcrR family transcriptional regulator
MRHAATTNATHRERSGYSEATRDKLLEAAGRAFAERGFAGATIREICKEAGANVAAVNYYFKDKLALYTEVLRQVAQAKNVDGVRAALEQRVSPEDALRDAVRARLRGIYGQKRPDWHFRIAAREFAQPTPAMSQVIDTVMRPIYSRLCGVVGKIIGRPPDQEQTRLCAHSVIGQMMHYILGGKVIHCLWPEMEMTPEQVERVANHIADFSLAYLHQVGAANREAAAQGSARNAQEKQNDRTANRSGRSAKSHPALAK